MRPTPEPPQSSSASSVPAGTAQAKDSHLYKEFLAEREEILRHKWIESEKAGHDIGFEKALLDWVLRHRASWREQRNSGLGASS